tara:strand:- start:2522 stop:3463 length:942 start_codon:yes stop_codon:yes gene_type:complete
MANTIQIKRHSSNTDTSAPSSLLSGELALSQAGKKLYVGRHNNSSVEVFHLPTLQDITYGNGVTGTVASGSDDNSVTVAVDVTDSNIFGTTSAKGIAQFNSDNFAVSSGVVTIKDNGVILGTETTGSYVASLVAGTGIALSNNSGEGATPTVAIDTSSSPTVAGITAGNVKVGVTADGEIDTSSGNLVIDSAGGTVQVDDNLTVTGNLTVNGTTTTVNSTTITIDDPIMTLGGDSAPGSDDNKDRGILAQYYDSSAKKMFFGMDDSNSHRFTYIPVATESTGVISGSVGDCQFATGYFTAISGATIDGGTFSD